MKNPILSMILCNTSRVIEPLRFLKSIDGNTSQIELIVVFQPYINETISNYLKENASNFYSLRFLEAPLISLSYARNIALKHATGMYLCFPDDDCWYSENLVEKIIVNLNKVKIEERCVGIAISYPGSKINTLSTNITYKNLLGNVISYSFFVKNPAYSGEIKLFNERLGVGCFFGAGEESEYLLRVLKRKNYIKPIKDLKVFHPINYLISPKREFSYGKGHGAINLIYLLKYPFFGLLISCRIIILPYLKVIINILNFKFYNAILVFISLIGRMIGLVCYLLVLLKMKFKSNP